MQIKKKVALVTGGANGIGFARRVTELLRDEAAHPYHNKKTGVRILTLCPSFTETQLATQYAERTLDIVCPEMVTAKTKTYPNQTVDSVAQAMLHVIKVGENGSVWFVEGGKPTYEIEVPDHPVKKLRG